MTSRDRIKELQKYVGADPDGVIGRNTMQKFADKFGRNRVQTIHFFANIHHESGGFSIVRENMNYSASRIMQIFGVGKHSARVTATEANLLSGKPYALAERVYGLGTPSKARELGNKLPGDGWKFRGGGAIQITGGDAYRRFGDAALFNNPDLIGTSAYYFTTAVKYFDLRNIWALAVDLSNKSIEAVCRAINGGLNGIEDRKNKVAHYANLWSATSPATESRKEKRTTANLNFRRLPSVGNNIMRVLPKGTVVEVLTVQGAWSEVVSAGVRGWVSTQYIA